MGYFPEGSLPVFDYLCDNFVVCDKWFASVPSGTFCNRLFALTGTSAGEVFNKCKEHAHITYDQPSIFDRLTDAGVTWKDYYSDLPGCASLLGHQNIENISRYQKISTFAEDVMNGELPYFSFIEPDYLHGSTGKISG